MVQFWNDLVQLFDHGIFRLVSLGEEGLQVVIVWDLSRREEVFGNTRLTATDLLPMVIWLLHFEELAWINSLEWYTFRLLKFRGNFRVLNLICIPNE